MIHTSDEPLEIDQQLGVWSGWISFPLGRVYLAKMKAEYPKTQTKLSRTKLFKTESKLKALSFSTAEGDKHLATVYETMEPASH